MKTDAGGRVTAHGKSRRRKEGVKKHSYRRYPKPPYAYAGLITAAIWSSPVGALSVSDIYACLRRMFAFFNADYTGWQSSVRHTLTNTTCFINKTIDSQRRWTVDAVRVPPEAFRRQATPEARRGNYALHLLTHLAAVDWTGVAPSGSQVGLTQSDIVTTPADGTRKSSFRVDSFLLPHEVNVCPRVGQFLGLSSAEVRPPSHANRHPFTVDSFLSSSRGHVDVKPSFPCATAAPPGVITCRRTFGFESRLPDFQQVDRQSGHRTFRPLFVPSRRPHQAMALPSHNAPRPFDIDSLLSSRVTLPSGIPCLSPPYTSWPPEMPPSTDVNCLSVGLFPSYAPPIHQSSERCNSLSLLADLVLASEGYM